MTENEAIQQIKKIYIDTNESDKCIALKMAISALGEVQKYREIGTVEECRDAVKRQIAKKPIRGKLYTTLGYYQCPMCGLPLHKNEKYCEECGNVLDWSML